VEFATASDMQEPAADIPPRGGFLFAVPVCRWLMENGFGT
jgi:hypothetical protein